MHKSICVSNCEEKQLHRILESYPSVTKFLHKIKSWDFVTKSQSEEKQTFNFVQSGKSSIPNLIRINVFWCYVIVLAWGGLNLQRRCCMFPTDFFEFSTVDVNYVQSEWNHALFETGKSTNVTNYVGTKYKIYISCTVDSLTADFLFLNESPNAQQRFSQRPSFPAKH